jgi:hypothetical protein
VAAGRVPTAISEVRTHPGDLSNVFNNVFDTVIDIDVENVAGRAVAG